MDDLSVCLPNSLSLFVQAVDDLVNAKVTHNNLLTHFMLLTFFYTLRKQETSAYLMFLGGMTSCINWANLTSKYHP